MLQARFSGYLLWLPFFIAGCFLPFFVQAQTESDQRPLVHIKDGLGLQIDSTFRINFRFRMQNRIGFWNRMDRADEPGFEARVRRLRLRLDGFVLSPRFAYYIQLSFSRADQDLVDGDISQIVRDAMVYYFIDPDFYIGFGQSKLPGNRQRVISSGNLQMPDRSLANQLFNIDRDFGFFLYKNFHTANQSEWHLKAALSSGEGRNINASDRGLAYTGRVEWLPLGKFINLGDYSEGDLEREPRPRLALGLSYSFNHRAVKSGGQLGREIGFPVDMQTAIADMVLKYRGWALSGEAFYRTVKASEPALLSDAEQRALLNIPAGNAMNIQLSRLIGLKNEIALRYTRVLPATWLRDYQPLLNTKAIAHTHYLRKHRVKVQTYLGLDDRLHPEVNPLPYVFRNRIQAMFQVEFGI
jgi:hypothetical protein